MLMVDGRSRSVSWNSCAFAGHRQSPLTPSTRSPMFKISNPPHPRAYRFAGGVDVRTVSDRLGHATPGFTLSVYSHAMSGTQEKAAEASSKFLVPAEDSERTRR